MCREKKKKKNQQWNIPIISALQRLRQKNYKFKTGLGYTGDLVSKKEEEEQGVVATAGIGAPSGHKIRIKDPGLLKIALCTSRMLYEVHDYKFNADFFVCKVRLEWSVSSQTY